MKKAISAAIALSMLLSFASCGRSPESSNSEQKIKGVKINLSDSSITVNGAPVTSNENDTGKTVFNLNAGGNTYTVF